MLNECILRERTDIDVVNNRADCDYVVQSGAAWVTEFLTALAL